MNKKDINEIRRHLGPGKNNFQKIYGCFVNTQKQIIANLEESFVLLPEFETDAYCGLLKKTLSGTLGKNLLDISFATQDVMEGTEYRLLSNLRSTSLAEPELRDEFYQKVIESVDLPETNFLILLVSDTYDVPARNQNDETDPDNSDIVFHYFLCCICPVKDSKTELGYLAGEGSFRGCISPQIVGKPELGFLFPAFEDRTANIYQALFYTRDPTQLHTDFLQTIFHTEAPMSCVEQKEIFENILSESLEQDWNLETAQSFHEQVRERMEQYAETKDPEPLELSLGEVGMILTNCGISEEKTAEVQEKCRENFGEAAVLNPANMIDSKRFELKTPQVKIIIDPEFSYLVETRIIDGRKYILIPSDDGIELNGQKLSQISEESVE